jgi:hypothetical protein
MMPLSGQSILLVNFKQSILFAHTNLLDLLAIMTGHVKSQELYQTLGSKHVKSQEIYQTSGSKHVKKSRTLSNFGIQHVNSQELYQTSGSKLVNTISEQSCLC